MLEGTDRLVSVTWIWTIISKVWLGRGSCEVKWDKALSLQISWTCVRIEIQHRLLYNVIFIQIEFFLQRDNCKRSRYIICTPTLKECWSFCYQLFLRFPFLGIRTRSLNGQDRLVSVSRLWTIISKVWLDRGACEGTRVKVRSLQSQLELSRPRYIAQFTQDKCQKEPTDFSQLRGFGLL